MPRKYTRIRRTPSFLAAFSEIRAYLQRSSPAAFLELPTGMQIILDVIDANPRSWPIRQKTIEGRELIFHLAVVNIAYRKLHIRYFVDADMISHLAAIWVDGNEEPTYQRYSSK
jgi:hypothetical protein